MSRGRVAEAMHRLLRAGGSAATSRATTVAGAALHHLEEGAGEGTVVLLHGGSGGGANWFRLLPRLAARYRVFAPDLPGFGLSPHRELRPPLGVQAATLLEQWLRQLQLPPVLLVGTSFGGLAALRLAQQAPERVSQLMLLDSAGLGRGLHPLVRVAALQPFLRAAVRPTHRGTALQFRWLLTRYRDELTGEQQQALVDYLFASADAAGTDFLAATLRLFIAPHGQREILWPAELAELPMPVSVVWGEADTFLPLSEARRAASHFRDAVFTTIPRAGHSPNWERADAVVAQIDALARR